MAARIQRKICWQVTNCFYETRTVWQLIQGNIQAQWLGQAMSLPMCAALPINEIAMVFDRSLLDVDSRNMLVNLARQKNGIWHRRLPLSYRQPLAPAPSADGLTCLQRSSLLLCQQHTRPHLSDFLRNLQ